MNQENREINLRVERVLIDYNKHLSRATDELGWHCFFVFFFFWGGGEELVDGNDKISVC